MKEFEVILQGVKDDSAKDVVLALYHAGFNVYKSYDGDVAFTATDEQVTEIKK